MTGAARTPRDFGETLRAIFSRYPRLLGTLLPAAVAIGLLQAATEAAQLGGLERIEAGEVPGPGFFAVVLAGLAGNAYLWTAALLRTDSALDGDRPGGEFARAAGLLPAVLVYLLLYVLAVTIGLLLFALPGIFLAVLLAPGVMLIVLRGSGAFAALKRSASLVWGSWWFSLGVMLTVTLASAVPMAIAEAFVIDLRGSGDPAAWMKLAGASVAATIVVLPLVASMARTLLEALEKRGHDELMARDLLRRADAR